MYKFLFLCIAVFVFSSLVAQDVVDYRYAQSPVRNQKWRGTCSSFSICAALETFPGVPSKLSEQYLFAKAKFKRMMDKDSAHMDEGEYLEYYLDILEQDGVITDAKMPYDTNAVTFTNDHDVFTQFKDVTKGSNIYDMLSFYNVSYRVTKDQYVVLYEDEARNIDNIKYWLNQGVKAIPVGYSINSYVWGIVNKDNPVIAPDSMIAVVLNGDTLSYTAAKKYHPDIVYKINNGDAEILPLWNNGIFDGGHAVTIVGYNRDGFIIKNSWGTNWGDGGYGIISYDYHKLWCSRALVLNKFNVNSNFTPAATEVYSPDDVCLKTSPILNAGKKSIGLSFLYDGDKPAPVFKNILVTFYLKDNASGLKQNAGKIKVLILPGSYKNGYYTEAQPEVDWNDLYNKQLSAEVTVTLSNGKVFTNVYPFIEWKNRTLHPGFLDALKFDDDE